MFLLWITTIRPQQKRAKEIQNMLDALELGDEISTAGGILGKVKKIKRRLCETMRLAKTLPLRFKKHPSSNTLPKGTLDSINRP